MMKKFAAVLMAVVVLTLGCSSCFAGSVKDTSKSIWNTIVNAEKTALQAVADTAVYLFTDDNAETAYASTRRRAGETKDEAVKTWDNACRAVDDAVDTVVGTVERYEAARDIVVTGLISTVRGVATGNFDYTVTGKCVDEYCEAYKKSDKDVVFDVCDLTGAGGLTVKGLKVVKSAGEYVVGYKDGEAVRDAVIDLVVSAVSEKVGEQVKGYILNEVGVKAAEEAAEHGADIATRLAAEKAAKAAGEKAAEQAGSMIGTVVEKEINTVINVADKVRNGENVGADDIDVDPVNDVMSSLVSYT